MLGAQMYSDKIRALADKHSVEPVDIEQIWSTGKLSFEEIDNLLDIGLTPDQLYDLLWRGILYKDRGQIDPTFVDALQPYRNVYRRLIYDVMGVLTHVLTFITRCINYIRR